MEVRLELQNDNQSTASTGGGALGSFTGGDVSEVSLKVCRHFIEKDTVAAQALCAKRAM